MHTVHTVTSLREHLRKYRRDSRTVGFVPTMGALHEGHISLLRRARSECDVVVLSIFVNPTQFGPAEDLAAYPRDPEADLRIAKQAGVDVAFLPDINEMYPAGFETVVDVPLLSAPLDGALRPGHFRGVATVVAKLLNIVGPDRAYFGEKDYQQLLVVRRMVTDLNIPTDIVAVPTERASDGLALSSRNAYLSPEQRATATALYMAIRTAAAYVALGGADAAAVQQDLTELISAEPECVVDYVAFVDPETLTPVQSLAGRSTRLMLAVRVGNTRLIDNALLVAPDAP